MRLTVDQAPSANLAVFGSPIAHSLSPALHRAAYAALGVDWVYGRREVEEHELADVLDGLDDSWRGLSLTMPLKREALRLADEVDEVARLAGGANTLLFERSASGTRRRAFNTDVYGVRRAIEPVVDSEDWSAATVPVIVGGGATAASVLVALAERRPGAVRILVRTPAKAAPLAVLGAELGVPARLEELLPGHVLEDASGIVVNTVPAAQGFPLEVPAALAAAVPLFEVSYHPWPSPAAALWQAAGGRIAHGLEMLIQQALIQVRIFTTGDPAIALPDEAAVLGAMRGAVPAVG